MLKFYFFPNSLKKTSYTLAPFNYNKKLCNSNRDVILMSKGFRSLQPLLIYGLIFVNFKVILYRELKKAFSKILICVF